MKINTPSIWLCLRQSIVKAKGMVEIIWLISPLNINIFYYNNLFNYRKVIVYRKVQVENKNIQSLILPNQSLLIIIKLSLYFLVTYFVFSLWETTKCTIIYVSFTMNPL